MVYRLCWKLYLQYPENDEKTVQYVRFPGGLPPESWTRPWLLNFGDRTGSGVSNQVWPYSMRYMYFEEYMYMYFVGS